MSYRRGLLLLATLPLLLASEPSGRSLAPGPYAVADAAADATCPPFGWFVHSIVDKWNDPDTSWMVFFDRLRLRGASWYLLSKDMPLCPGDALMSSHRVTTTFVRKDNVASIVVEGDSLLTFSDRPVQRAGTVTYLLPSGWGELIEVTLQSGTLLISDLRGTVQVSMMGAHCDPWWQAETKSEPGPICDPTVEVSVSALDAPFLGGSTTPHPRAHHARLTLLDRDGRPVGRSLVLHGDESVRVVPEQTLPDHGDPLSDAARKVFLESEPRLRAPLAQRGPPTAAERKALAPSYRTIVVYADKPPAETLVNSLPWTSQGWRRVESEDEGRWVSETKVRLPPGPSIVNITLSDGRRGAVVAPPSGDVVLDQSVWKNVTPPSKAAPCDVPPLGGPTGDKVQPAVPGLNMTFVGLSSGHFCMGSPEGVGDPDEHPQHLVRVNGFLMGQSEVTQAQWRLVVEAGKAKGDPDAAPLNTDPSHAKGDTLPVTNVSWCDTLRFANVLSRLDDRVHVYNITTDAKDPRDCAVRIRRILGSTGYTLPTEAEWEYAARAGSTTAYTLGDDESDLARAAWTDGNSDGATHEVCTAPEKPWGLCDMLGNVEERGFDAYDETEYLYSAHRLAPHTGPLPPALDELAYSTVSDTIRSTRGGSCVSWAEDARSANRGSDSRTDSSPFTGFRLVLPYPRTP